MSYKAKVRYIDKRTNLIKENILLKDSSIIPKRLRRFQDFKKQFDNKRNYLYTFCGYKLLINISYAYKHFQNNTYNEPRHHLNGTLYDILHNPLIVVINGAKDTLSSKDYRNTRCKYYLF